MDAQADAEVGKWRQATKIKLGTDFEECTRILLGNNRLQASSTHMLMLVIYSSDIAYVAVDETM